MNPPKRGRGRPRREGADEEILAVAREMLREIGYRDLTVDAVAERAGVAKTTVYRRWPSKSALVASLIEPPPASDAASVLRETAEVLALLRDAETIDVIRAALLPRREQLLAITGSAGEADSLLGTLLVRWLSESR